MRPTTNRPRPLAELADLLGATASPYERPRGSATGVTHDSRAVAPGDLYVALPGSRFHGADFVAAAVEAGAVAVLTDPAGRNRAVAAIEGTEVEVLVVDEPRRRLGEVASWVYGDPVASLELIGVTGTSGKTTVTYLLESGLRAAGHTTGLIGTVEMRVAGKQVPSSLTTPEATDLHGLFAAMREQGVTAAAMEVSSHALAYDRVGGARYDVAIFTNLSRDHLDFHPTMQDYFATKARLFTPAYSRVGVVNLDDLYGRALIDVAKIPVTTYSADGDPDADWRAYDVRLGADGTSFRVVGPLGIEADASVRMPGPFNVSNALAAIVGLVEAGEGLQDAVTGVAACPGVPGRMERVEAGQPFTALVDYSHKPGAVEAVLSALRPVTDDRLIVVLGCGGDRDREKRPMMGEAAARLADMAIFTDDNPRTEDSLTILAAMMDGVLEVPAGERAHITVEPDRATAIELAVVRARPGDVLVVAGKGHEQGQYVGDEVLPFDDRVQVRDAVRRLASPAGNEDAQDVEIVAGNGRAAGGEPLT